MYRLKELKMPATLIGDIARGNLSELRKERDLAEIELNEILLNSHNRNMKERIIIFDDKGDYYIFKHSNIMERIKQIYK